MMDNYSFASVKKQKVQNLMKNGELLKIQAPILAKHLSNEILSDVVNKLNLNKTTDVFYNEIQPLLLRYQISFETPSSTLVKAMNNSQDEMNSSCLFKMWSDADNCERVKNKLWRKNWQDLLCRLTSQKLLESLNESEKFQSFHFYVSSNVERSKMTSIQESDFINEIIVRIGDIDHDPTQTIFDNLFIQNRPPPGGNIHFPPTNNQKPLFNFW